MYAEGVCTSFVNYCILRNGSVKTEPSFDAKQLPNKILVPQVFKAECKSIVSIFSNIVSPELKDTLKKYASRLASCS